MSNVLIQFMNPEQAQQFLQIVEKWRRSNKSSFLYELTLLLDNTLRCVAGVPEEVQRERVEWQRFHEDHLYRLENTVLALVAQIQNEGEALSQHWDYAVQERNGAHDLAQQVFADLQASIEKLSRIDREREVGFTRMMDASDKRQALICEKREQEIDTFCKQQTTRTKLYCAGVTIVSIAFCGLFCHLQNQGKRLIALQAEANVQAQVTEQLQHVEPTTYQMASEIARHCHQVNMQDGLPAWEVDLLASSGIFSMEPVLDEQGYPKVFRIFMRGDPQRLTLDALAADKKDDPQSTKK